MELLDVVRKLVGPIEPIGDTQVDDDRYSNLLCMTRLLDALISDVDAVTSHRSRMEYSMRRAGEHASEFFDSLGIRE